MLNGSIKNNYVSCFYCNKNIDKKKSVVYEDLVKNIIKYFHTECYEKNKKNKKNILEKIFGVTIERDKEDFYE